MSYLRSGTYKRSRFNKDPGLIDRIKMFEDRRLKGDLIEMYINQIPFCEWARRD